MSTEVQEKSQRGPIEKNNGDKGWRLDQLIGSRETTSDPDTGRVGIKHACVFCAGLLVLSQFACGGVKEPPLGTVYKVTKDTTCAGKITGAPTVGTFIKVPKDTTVIYEGGIFDGDKGGVYGPRVFVLLGDKVDCWIPIEDLKEVEPEKTNQGPLKWENGEIVFGDTNNISGPSNSPAGIGINGVYNQDPLMFG